MVRLGIELGLNHDPTAQNIFDESECQLRIRLWGIVLVHDRGTSLLLGRPLAISPNDTNTPHPMRPKSVRPDLSEHFTFSHPIAQIQADIINSLYSPHGQSADSTMRHTNRIVKSMIEFRRQLPERYKRYFGGTADWSLEEKTKLVQDITEDEGLTLLKIGIARILLLRALFSNKELEFSQRHKALLDGELTIPECFEPFIDLDLQRSWYHTTSSSYIISCSASPTYHSLSRQFLCTSQPWLSYSDTCPVATRLHVKSRSRTSGWHSTCSHRSVGAGNAGR